MSEIKILFVEDDLSQQKVFKDTLEIFNNEASTSAKEAGNSPLTITSEIKNDLDTTLQNINSSYDGLILDLNLNDDEAAGNKIIKKLKENFIRIPVICVTGYPESIEQDSLIVTIYPKGGDGTQENGVYKNCLDLIKKIYITGVTRIMGGRGEIERLLFEIFRTSILPQKDAWLDYGEKDSTNTEKALLRYSLSQLIYLLEDGEDEVLPEEFYIYPANKKEIKPGTIITERDCLAEQKVFFVVMTPACDLIIRDNGESNTDFVLLARVQPHSIFIKEKHLNVSSSKSATNELESLIRNKKNYYHWLPKTNFFEGGFLNFRDLRTEYLTKIRENYEISRTQISQTFSKDIMARFASYYARQGQPDIDIDKARNKLKG